VKGDPSTRSETQGVAHVPQHRITPTIAVSDSALKFTHVFYNLSPAGRFQLFSLISIQKLYHL
jgi:phosphoenolpyruvate carboxykinase (ATP)